MTFANRVRILIRRLFRREPAPPLLKPEELQRLFNVRCRAFHELLTANSAALQAMAELDRALHDGRTLSMPFIRGRCTLVTITVYKIIRNLNALGEDRYCELTQVFARLRDAIDALLAAPPARSGGDLALTLDRISRDQADLAGEKMAHLGEAGTLADIRIPPGFALTAVATRLFFERNQLYPKINHLIQQMDVTNLEDLHAKSAAIQAMVQDCPLPPELDSLLFAHFDRLADAVPGCRVAVRPSALGEDLGQASYAGLYHTELEVGRDRLAAAYRQVLASKYTPRAISYRLAKGFRHEETEMCVGFLVMIEAAISGVCYSRSLGGRGDTLDLFFAPGGARAIVDGTGVTGRLLLSRTAPHVLVGSSPIADEAAELTEAQTVLLAETAMRLEHHFGEAQDIEWSIDQTGTLYVLQSRPISAAVLSPPSPDKTLPADVRLLLHGGVTGCGGGGCGPVCIVCTGEEMLRFPRRAVLVVKHPLPEWAPLLKRAIAVVAETGSVASHLATLSREFELPSLLSLERATEVLTNGETVTVDADGRAVYRGRIEELLRQPAPRLNPMQGSPVHRTLIALLQLITPLTLTDPASPDFQPARCRTLHDITRFCHEQAVVEMIAFGKRHRFDRGPAKRLEDSLPLQWRVIDLGGGFAPGYDVRRSEIEITDIACTPLRAIWAGMHAVPWQGPPVAGMKAMAAFLVQSALRGGLDMACTSALLGEKNYFLVAQKYCIFKVLLGYHFAMIEALLGDRPGDRSLTFRFKGGAATEAQRLCRIDLLTEVLEHFGFRIDRVGDALTARVVQESEQFVIDRLKVLGYLTIHTRQLDMVLAEAGAQRRFRDRFIHEIGTMLNHE